MLTTEALFKLAADLTHAEADDDAESLAAIAWQSYEQADRADARLRAARPAR